MMTLEILITKLDINPKEMSRANALLLEDLVRRYNLGYVRKSIYLSKEEVLIREAEGIVHGYLPEIEGIVYDD